MNISSAVPVWKNLGVGKWKKVATTGNIGKKTQAGDIDYVDIYYVSYLSMQKVNLN